MKITEKLHGQCFWLLTVARGVVLNEHLKMLELFMFDKHVCHSDRSVELESFRLTAYFCKTFNLLSIFMCYWLCVLVKIILDLDFCALI